MQADFVARNNEANLKLTSNHSSTEDDDSNNNQNHSTNHEIDLLTSIKHKTDLRTSTFSSSSSSTPSEVAPEAMAFSSNNQRINEDKNRSSQTMDPSVLQQFYDGKNVFVTGGTGNQLHFVKTSHFNDEI